MRVPDESAELQGHLPELRVQRDLKRLAALLKGLKSIYGILSTVRHHIWTTQDAAQHAISHGMTIIQSTERLTRTNSTAKGP